MRIDVCVSPVRWKLFQHIQVETPMRLNLELADDVNLTFSHNIPAFQVSPRMNSGL